MISTHLPPVSVLGLGAMGAALARAFLTAGHPTTVWNRTTARARPFEADGAVVAPDPAAAVRASELVVVCLLDAPAVRATLDRAVTDLPGRVVADLTSATPEARRETAAWVEGQRASYLEGAIMVPTPLVGRPEALVLYSGARSAFDTHRATLSALGGDSDFVGERVGLASVHDLGMLGVFFTAMTSFLQAGALLEAEGVSFAGFRPYAERITAILPDVFAGLARDADAADFPGTEDRVVMNEAAIGHIVEASEARGVDTSLLDAVRLLARRSIDRGHGDDGFSRIVEEIRTPAT